MLGYLALGALAAVAAADANKTPSLPAETHEYRGGQVRMLAGPVIAAQAVWNGVVSQVFYPGQDAQGRVIPASVMAATWIDASIYADEIRRGVIDPNQTSHDAALAVSPVENITPPVGVVMPARPVVALTGPAARVTPGLI